MLDVCDHVFSEHPTASSKMIYIDLDVFYVYILKQKYKKTYKY